MNNLILSTTTAFLLTGCVLHGIPAPLQAPYVWDDSAEPIQPLRADAVKAAGTVVEYLNQTGFFKVYCSYSLKVHEVAAFETEQAFEIVLVRRPGWCSPFYADVIPPMGDNVDEIGISHAVRRSDMRLLRQRWRSDPYSFRGKIYGPGNNPPEEFDEFSEQLPFLIEQWEKRFSTLSPQAQEAFRKDEVVIGMTHEEFKLMMEYQEATKARFELHLSGVREELGRPKQERWLFCKPNCWRPELRQLVIVENGVVSAIQSGDPEPEDRD